MIQEPGEVEEEFVRIGPARLFKGILTSHLPTPLVVPKGQNWKLPPKSDVIPLPPWFAEEDLKYLAEKNWELTGPWTGAQVQVPMKFITGDKDLIMSFPGTEDYIEEGSFKKDVPLLQDVVIMKGIGHFINQEKVNGINKHILDFF
ncbi:hypothetical protein Nepgr_027777 [Nepenthes gracilis]|uniref:Epoxide hydrolase n=1 Tax=Nepenthes gracilis TaxID=150966 RepID=A0AAD3Y3F8_NEPGR|nr:hypothetical protein Nepgr_027777 [Nepenthes gracilis]